MKTKNKFMNNKMSSSESLTKSQEQEIIKILQAIELMEMKKKLKKKQVSQKKQKDKRKQKYVNELQKNIAKQFDINIPKSPPKSISKSYGK
jgi:hypothetical protein